MSSKLDSILAERRGSRIAEKFGLSAFPIDPSQVAQERGITIAAKPLEGCAGCLVRQGDNFGIVYAESLANVGMVNFTIAHELGHYFLDGHAEALFPEGSGIHRSSEAFRSADPREREADHFAVGLLLPEKLFADAMRRSGHGVAAVKALSAKCQTSLTATAIRYATLSEDHVAVIVSTGRRVDFCFLSQTLRDHRGLEWLKKGASLPSGTATARLAADPGGVERAERKSSGGSFPDWFDGAPDVECEEEVVGLGRFGQTLTVLWSDEPIEEDEPDEDNH